jgi:hypothetical protein
MSFSFIKLFSPCTYLLFFCYEFLVVCLVLFTDLVQMSYQNRILLLKQGDFVLKGTSFLTLVKSDGFDELLKVDVFIFDDIL